MAKFFNFFIFFVIVASTLGCVIDKDCKLCVQDRCKFGVTRTGSVCVRSIKPIHRVTQIISNLDQCREFQNEMQKHALQDSTSTTTTLKPIQVAVPLAVPDRSTPTSTTTSNTTTTQPTTTSSTTTTPAPTSSSTTVTPTTNATSTTPIPFLVPIVFSDIQFANKTGEASGLKMPTIQSHPIKPTQLNATQMIPAKSNSSMDLAKLVQVWAETDSKLQGNQSDVSAESTTARAVEMSIKADERASEEDEPTQLVADAASDVAKKVKHDTTDPNLSYSPVEIGVKRGRKKELILKNFPNIQIINGCLHYKGNTTGFPVDNSNPRLALRLLRNLAHQILLIKQYRRNEGITFLDNMLAQNPLNKYPEMCYELTGRQFA